MHELGIGTEETPTIVVDHVIRCICDPDFGFPSDGFRKTAEGVAVCEGREEDQLLTAWGELCRQFLTPGLIHVMARVHGVEEKQPVAIQIVNDHIGSRGGIAWGDFQFKEPFAIRFSTWKEDTRRTDVTWREIRHYRFDQLVARTAHGSSDTSL